MKFIRNLEMALVRIENKTYGICKTTGKLIPKGAPDEVPHATECIEAKEDAGRTGRARRRTPTRRHGPGTIPEGGKITDHARR